MEEIQRKMLQFPLLKLNKIGLLNAYKTSIKLQLFTLLLGISVLYCFLSTSLQYFYMRDANIFDFIENSEAFVGLMQVIVKLWCCILCKEKFQKLIQLTEKFWSTENCSESVKDEVDSISRKIITFQKVYFYAVVGFSPAFILTTFFGKKLPIGSWNMKNEGIFYRSVYLSYWLIVPGLSYVLACFEGLFLGFCYEIKMQFLILGKRFENLSVDHIRSCEDLHVYNEQLRNNIQHHILLLKFVNELQNTYSLTFAVQSFTMAPMISTEMYAATESTDILVMFRYGFVCIVLIVQFAFYCIPGSFVISDASIIGDGVYNSDWFSKSFPQLRMPLMFLMQASQRELKFTACGLTAININTFVKVLKVAFSANAVLKSLKE